MSADRQRLKSAIQRIAKEDPEIRGLLGESSNKGGKASSAGIGTSEAEESRLCCDGSTSSSANPGTEERDPDASSQDGLDSSDPAKLSSGEGILSGVTDCATGEPICFDGAECVPPDGWESCNEPGVAPSYVAGSYYKAIKGPLPGTTVAGTEAATASESVALFDATEPESLYLGPPSSTSFAYDVMSTSGGEEYVYGYLNLLECSPESSADYCNPDPEDIQADAWPEDGCTNLYIKDGFIVGSKYDPDQDGSYSAPRDSIDLCDGSGNQISLAPSANGGWKTINSTTDSGYLYDSSGQQIAHIDGNEYSDPNV